MLRENNDTSSDSIIWTLISPNSKLNEIEGIIEGNLWKEWIKKLSKFLEQQDYIWFQKEIGLTWNDVDGRLWVKTYNRLIRYIEDKFQADLLLTILSPVIPNKNVRYKIYNNPPMLLWENTYLGTSVWGDNFYIEIWANAWKDAPNLQHKDYIKNTNKNTVSFKTWTETSENSKLNEIKSLLNSFWKNDTVENLLKLLDNKEYKDFQKEIWMEPWFCDWKLWSLTVKYLDYYLKENVISTKSVSKKQRIIGKEARKKPIQVEKFENRVPDKAKVSPSDSYNIDSFDIITSKKIKKIWNSLKWKEKPELEPFACAFNTYMIEKAKWRLKNQKYLTIIDFTKSQQNNRFFVINLDTKTVEYAEKCWHWLWSWDTERTTSFSNENWSNKSSLWVFITPNRPRANYKGTWLWSFPTWQEASNNTSRWIAIHPVNSLIDESWKLTSEWCFTIPISQSALNEILVKINWWSLVFAYAKSKDYFLQSKYFQENSEGNIVI